MSMSRRLSLTAATALTTVAAALCASPAQAQPVIVVDRRPRRAGGRPVRAGTRGHRSRARSRPPAGPGTLGRAGPPGGGPRPGPGRTEGRHHRARQYSRYRRTYRRARATLGRLSGARRRELGYVVRSVERVALAGRLTATRMPAIFLQLRRNSAYWPSKPFPATGDQLTFRGSELLYPVLPRPRPAAASALELQEGQPPERRLRAQAGKPGKPVCGARPPGPTPGTPCRPERLRRLLDELSGLAVQRHRGFVAWEYLFDFGGGSPPWMSGMAQAVAVTALTRGARRLNRPDYAAIAERGAGGVRDALAGRRPDQGTARRGALPAVLLRAAPLHLQRVPPGADRAARLRQAHRQRPRHDPVPAGRARGAGARCPYSSTGNWSRYSFRGARSTALYHELLREILQSLGRRLGKLGGIYCRYAIRYRQFQDRRR